VSNSHAAGPIAQVQADAPNRNRRIDVCGTQLHAPGYAKCLAAAVPTELLVDAERGKETRGLSPDDVARMEHELESLGREFKSLRNRAQEYAEPNNRRRVSEKTAR
jgi:hypothetical protein